MAKEDWAMFAIPKADETRPAKSTAAERKNGAARRAAEDLRDRKKLARELNMTLEELGEAGL